MDWDEASGANNNGSIFLKVMTDEQMEILRQQIAAYATICQQLVDLHKSYTSQHDFAGVRLGNLYNDPSVTSSGHRITGRQRWTPTAVQLQILEGIFDQGNGTPSKQKIKEITSDLSQHGPISETNVYNWFQNRRARSKRKQNVSATNNGESEVETEVDSPNEQKTNHNNSAAEDLCFQNPEVSSGMHYIDPRSNKVEPVFPSDTGSKPVEGLGEMSFYERMEHLVGKMEIPVVTYNSYTQAEEDYITTG